MKAGRPSKKAKKQASASDVSKIKFRVSKALQLIDKNSRTFQKIAQLLEVLPPVESPNDAHLLVSRRIEKLKMRLNRRLIKLAKWADLPEHERQQVPVVNPMRTNLQPPLSNNNRVNAYPSNAKVNYTQPVRFHQNPAPPTPLPAQQLPRGPISLPTRSAPPTMPATPLLSSAMSVSAAGFPGITRLVPGSVPRIPNYALLTQKMAENAQAASNGAGSSSTSVFNREG